MSTQARMLGEAAAAAHSNIALVKYWGKRDAELRLPQNGSLSLTLEGLTAETSVRFGASEDRFTLNGEARTGPELARVSRFLDLVRGRAGLAERAEVESRTSFPVAAGLASSAAGFAALAAAASAAAGLELSGRELSILARLGSGSACRSVFGGLVEWRRGERPDGADSFAEPLLAPESWPLAMAVAVLDPGPKAAGSTEGMARSAAGAGNRLWLATVEADLAAARRAVAERDLRTLGLVAESNAAKMHLAAAAAGVVYWTEGTARLFSRIAELREEGLEAYATADAGPNVAVLCREAGLGELARRLEAEPGVRQVLRARAGGGVRVLARR